MRLLMYRSQCGNPFALIPPHRASSPAACASFRRIFHISCDPRTCAGEGGVKRGAEHWGA